MEMIAFIIVAFIALPFAGSADNDPNIKAIRRHTRRK